LASGRLRRMLPLRGKVNGTLCSTSVRIRREIDEEKIEGGSEGSNLSSRVREASVGATWSRNRTSVGEKDPFPKDNGIRARCLRLGNENWLTSRRS